MPWLRGNAGAVLLFSKAVGWRKRNPTYGFFADLRRSLAEIQLIYASGY